MIVETQSLTTISVGSQKAQSEQGDTAIKIPNIMLPVIELVEPTLLNPLSNYVNQSSFQSVSFYSKTNLAAGVFTLCTLGKGYWVLDWLWNLKVQYAAVVPFNTNGNVVQLVSPIGGASANLGSQLPYQTGFSSVRWFNRLLLRENAEIAVGFGLTGAADFLDGNIHLNAVKLL